MEPQFSPAAIRAALTTTLFGQAVEYYPQLGSTNDLLRERASAGAAEGLLIVADEQVAGRGRMGRSWTAPAGSAILASLLLRPRLTPQEAFAPTMIFGLAVQQAAVAFGVPAALKWPNDVLVGDKKLTGILCEVSMGEARGAWVVAGFGVNANFDPAQFGLGAIATSLANELGRAVDRLMLLDAILRGAERRYLGWQAGDYGAVWAEWRANLATLGRQVRVEQRSGEVIAGLATDVAGDGTLLVSTAAGERRVISGVVEVLPGPL